jgi:hypothetical protein
MPVFRLSAKVRPGKEAEPSEKRAVPPTLKVSVVVAELAESPPAKVKEVDH